MSRRVLPILGLLLAVAMMLSACPAPAAAPSGEAASASGDAAPAASTEGVKISAVMGDTIREGEQAAIDYCVEQTGLKLKSLTAGKRY
ncbi:MAG: hypothetical protein R3E79_19745 [Caldilineaceae bacterium]